MAEERSKITRSGTVDTKWLELLGDNIQLSDAASESDLCWHNGKGLKVWDCAVRGIPKLNRGHIDGYDVVLITVHALQQHDSWVTGVKWTTVLADEGHEFLRGQHGKSEQSITLRNWMKLQAKTKSMFIISGTPFVTNIVHDFSAMTRAVA